MFEELATEGEKWRLEDTGRERETMEGGSLRSTEAIPFKSRSEGGNLLFTHSLYTLPTYLSS